MSVSGTGTHATFASTTMIAGRSVNSVLSLFVTVPDGKPSPNDPATNPFVTVAVSQTDKVTGATLFEGLRYSNAIDFKLETGHASAHLKIDLKVSSYTSSDSRMVHLDLLSTPIKPIEDLSQSSVIAEEGNVKNEKHTAKVRQCRCGGTVTIKYPGANGQVISLGPSGDPVALWKTKSAGHRVAKQERGKRGGSPSPTT